MYVTDFDEFLVNEPCSCQHLELPPDLSQSAREKGGGPCLESAREREYFFPCTSQRMSDEAGTASGTTRAGHVLTLNSRRLTAHVLRRVAISASPDDLRQMIDGALAEREEDPRSVLIAQLDTDDGVVIELRNCFFTIPPELGTMEMLQQQNTDLHPHRHHLEPWAERMETQSRTRGFLSSRERWNA